MEQICGVHEFDTRHKQVQERHMEKDREEVKG